MKFMMMVKATQASEAGQMPTAELIGEMGRYNETLFNAGVLVDLGGLQPSAKGIRRRFRNGESILIDGPFAETKDLIAGYWLINVKSRDEALSWLKQVPCPAGDGAEAEVELRPLFEMSDFEPSPELEHQKQLGQRLAAEK